MKNNSNKANGIINVVRGIIVLLVFLSPDIVSAANIEVTPITYGPISELAWEYDSFVEHTWQNCGEILDDIEDWSYVQDEELRVSSCVPVRVLGEYSQKCRGYIVSAANDAVLNVTRSIVDQHHRVTELWFSKG